MFSSREEICKVEGIGKRLAEEFNGWIANKHKEREIEIEQEKRKKKENARRVARYRWKRAFGAIPSGYEIHHIDGNPQNNNIDNLRCLSKKAHLKIHQNKM